MKWTKEQEAEFRKIYAQQFTDHIIFGVSGIELVDNTVKNIPVEQVLNLINGQADKETNREDGTDTQYLQN